MTDWTQHDGKIVTLDGIKHRLEVRQWNAIYPYPHQVTKVDAVPVNKNTKYYRDTKALLGDDWSTDVLESDVEVQCEVLRQVA